MNEGCALRGDTATPLGHDFLMCCPLAREQRVTRDVHVPQRAQLLGLAVLLSSRIINLDPSLSRASPLASSVRPGGVGRGPISAAAGSPLPSLTVAIPPQ